MIEANLNKQYVGKKVKEDFEEIMEAFRESEWSSDYSDDEGINGTGYIELDYRPYNSYEEDELDEEEENDESELDFDDEEDDEEDYEEYSDESDNWSLRTALDFKVKNGVITKITIRAEVLAFGDSGLGDCDPEDEWSCEDENRAEEFFDAITE